MRMVIASAFCLFAALPAAQASGIQAGFIAGQASGNQGSTYNNTTSIYGAGNATGSSASGTGFSLGAADGSHVTYFSRGSANSSTVVTPFSVNTSSSHEAFSAGHASDGASFTATNQTFGQSNGNSNFSSSQVTTTGYVNKGFQVSAALGFVNFEGGFGS